MASFLPPASLETESFEDLQNHLVSSLTLGHGERCDIDNLREHAARLAAAYRPIISAAERGSGPGTAPAPSETLLADTEDAYRAWISIDAAFENVLGLAYSGDIPRDNLLVDDVRTYLETRVGDNIADAYTQLLQRRSAVDASQPWNAHTTQPVQHLEKQDLDRALSILVRGDDLDIEDALQDLTGRLQHAFIDHLETHADALTDLELGLWKRPEIIVARDYWGRRGRVRLIDTLKAAGSPRFRDAATRLDRFFADTPRGAAAVVSDLRKVPEGQRERFNRCLMLHPDHEVRRYAVSNADINEIWKVMTPSSVPCSTILSVLEHIVGSARYTVAQRKIFFDTIYRRLLSLSSRSDILYARGIARILTRQNFFLEDRYFSRLLTVINYVSAKEKLYRIDDDLMAGYVGRLRRQKDRAGSIDSEDPEFSGVPLVVLRKIARDGHFWSMLSTHPIVKIARETIPYINTEDRALQVVRNHRVNPEVVREIGRRRGLFVHRTARTALLTNPKTPPSVSQTYLADLTRNDIEVLLRASTLHAEFRIMLRRRNDLWQSS